MAHVREITISFGRGVSRNYQTFRIDKSQVIVMEEGDDAATVRREGLRMLVNEVNNEAAEIAKDSL